MNQPAYLQALAYRLGELRPIDELPELSATADDLETLKLLGVGQYARAEGSAPELAEAAARACLERAGVAGEEVDAVVYATSTFWGEEQYRVGLRRCFHALGLSRAFPLSIFGSECSNVMTALKTALSLVQAQRLRRVLVISSDCSAPGKRVIGGLASVFSDGAVACLVGPDVGPFRLDELALHSNSGMWDVEPETNLIAFLRGNVQGACQAIKACRASLQLEMRDFALILTGNYNRSVLKTFRFAFGCTVEQHFQDNVARFAHSYSADTLINLLDCYEARLPVSTRALLCATGQSTWGALAITRMA